MGLMTKAEYIGSLRTLSPAVYMFGQKPDNVVDNPRIRAGIEAAADPPSDRDLENQAVGPVLKKRLAGIGN